MKKLVFGEGLMVGCLNGSKRFMVRKYRPEAHDFKKDEVVIGEFKDGLNILLRITADTKVDTFSRLKNDVKKQSARRVGYCFDENYFTLLKEYYPDLKWHDTGAIVFFEVLKVDGIPVVSVNQMREEL